MRDTKTELSRDETFLKQLMAVVRRTALAEMASGMAHELNQPLAAIATYSHAGERMLNRPEPMVEQALEVFRQIIEPRSAERGRAIEEYPCALCAGASRSIALSNVGPGRGTQADAQQPGSL